MLDTTRATGIDVSHWHPIQDAGAIRGAGISFIGAKITNGMGTDAMARTHIAAIRTQPFVLAIYYHFAMPGDPVKQADHLLDTIGPLRGNERLALDVEGGQAPHLPWIVDFMGELARTYTDRRHIVYSSARVLNRVLAGAAWPGAAAYDLWLPRYSTDEPEIPSPWTSWQFWQFSQTYQCDGVGTCDANYFCGDIPALKAYAALQPSAVASTTPGPRPAG